MGNVSSSLLFVCSQPRHKHLFSDVPRIWQDAREECELYGGWLLNIGGVEEQNCIVSYGRSQRYDAWYLTDGMYHVLSLSAFPHTIILNSFSAHTDEWGVGPCSG